MDTPTLKRLIRSELPENAFRPQPLRALLLIPILATIICCTWFIVQWSPPWYIAVPISLAVGNVYGMLAFLAHEALHGSIFRSGHAQNVIGYLGFTIFFISPCLWRVWHNMVHHGFTNQGNRDPDSFGTMNRFQRAPSTRFVAKLAPGSRHWPSYFFLFYWFTFHSQMVLWLQSKYSKAFVLFKFNRRQAIMDSFLMIGFWVAVAIWAGPKGSLYAVFIPMIVANFILMSYIATNHFLRPQSRENEPLADSMSVATHPLLDWLHLNFSHHVEHHLYPAMNPRFAPLVRQVLRRYVPDQYVSPPHWKALWYLYRTPRLYLDAQTLVEPFTGWTVRLADIEPKLFNRSDPFQYV